MSAHTPGPWTLGNENDAGAEVCAGPVVICLDRSDPFTGRYVISREEMLANTALVIAVPDLLAALEGLLRAFEEGSEDVDGCLYFRGVSCEEMKEPKAAARAAIAKARGGA